MLPTDANKLRTRRTEYAEFFTACGYKRDEVLEQMRRVLLKSQEQCLELRENKELRTPIPLVTTYNPHATYIAEMAHRHWGFLKSKEHLSRIFAEPLLIAYRRPKNRDKLVSTKLKEKPEEEDTNGCKPCEQYHVAGAEKLTLLQRFWTQRENAFSRYTTN